MHLCQQVHFKMFARIAERHGRTGYREQRASLLAACREDRERGEYYPALRECMLGLRAGYANYLAYRGDTLCAA